MNDFERQNSELSYSPVFECFPAQIIWKVFGSYFIIRESNNYSSPILKLLEFFGEAFAFIPLDTARVAKIGQNHCFIYI